MFSDIMLSTNKLKSGTYYTFTYDAGFIIGVLIGTTDYILTRLRPVMQDFADIIKVDHAFLSKKFLVTIVPKVEMSLEEWINFFAYAWNQIGYKSTQFIQAESGITSTQPGGIKGGVTEIAKGTGEIITGGVTETLRSLTPVLIIGAIGLATVLFIKVKGR